MAFITGTLNCALTPVMLAESAPRSRVTFPLGSERTMSLMRVAPMSPSPFLSPPTAMVNCKERSRSVLDNVSTSSCNTKRIPASAGDADPRDDAIRAKAPSASESSACSLRNFMGLSVCVGYKQWWVSNE